jgi:hypothetical protein
VAAAKCCGEIDSMLTAEHLLEHVSVLTQCFTESSEPFHSEAGPAGLV